MKPKTIYILMIIFSMSLFSSAKQTGKCDNQSCCEYNKQKCGKNLSQPKVAEKKDYDLSPLSLCLFNI